jgi:hypothetical protein
MKQLLLAAALGLTALAATPADAHDWDRIEDRFDRAENRLDRRENRWDRRENRWDRRH